MRGLPKSHARVSEEHRPLNLTLSPSESCPCGRPRSLARCCLRRGRLAPSRASTPRPSGSRRHDRCYAAVLGGCSDKITLEHYVSHCILEVLGSTGLRVEGLNRKPYMTSAAKFGGKVLCEAHNNALDPLDRVGKAFFTGLTTTSDYLSDRRGPPRRVRLLNGHDVERWFLKTLIGFVATFEDWEPPESWLRVLFGEEELGQGEGLVLDILGERPAGPQRRAIRLDRIDNSQGEHLGLGVTMETFRFGLAMAPGVFTGLHRPYALRFFHDAREAIQLLVWDSPQFNSTVHIAWSP